MKSSFLNETARGFLAIALSMLLIPAGQPGLFAQDAPPPPPQGDYQQGPPPGNYVPLGADQLNQLVAPIALYPDSLVAQVLTAATYPQQVQEASNWLAQTANMPPEQRAAAANTMQWDPSVKALTAFPSVVSNLARNYQWAQALGNAYYNQPGDVMNAVQAMRMQAQQAGHLRSDSHYRVYDNSGVVVIEPAVANVVYVPYYDPWAVYGVPISPWRGYYWGGPPRGVVLAAGLGIGFAAGISIALFSNYGWGYHHWEPNWRGGVVVYNHNTYISRSTTVVNRGYFGYHNRGVYERPGAGVPRNFRPPVTSQSAAFRPGQGRPGEFRNSQYSNRPAGVQGSTAPRQFGRPTDNRQVNPPINNQPAGRQFGQPRQNAPTTTPGGGTYNRTQQAPGGGTYNRTQQAPGAGTYNRATPTPGAGTYNRPTGTYNRPQAPSAPTPAPQVRTPQAPANNGGGTYRQQHMNNGGGASQRPAERPAARPAERPAERTAPSHPSNSNSSHSSEHSDHRR